MFGIPYFFSISKVMGAERYQKPSLDLQTGRRFLGHAVILGGELSLACVGLLDSLPCQIEFLSQRFLGALAVYLT